MDHFSFYQRRKMTSFTNDNATVISGTVKSVIDQDGNFTVQLPTPIELTTELDYAGVAIREVEYILAKKYRRSTTFILRARRKGHRSYKTIKVCNVDDRFLNTTEDFFTHVKASFQDLKITKGTTKARIFRQSQDALIDLNDYLEVQVHGNIVTMVNKSPKLDFHFIFYGHGRYYSGVNKTHVHIHSLKTTVDHIYLSMDDYNYLECLSIELEGVEKTFTDEGYKPLLTTFYRHNDGTGYISYKPKPRVEYRKLEKLGWLRELNFTVKSLFDQYKWLNTLLLEHPCLDKLARGYITIKYEIILVGKNI